MRIVNSSSKKRKPKSPVSTPKTSKKKLIANKESEQTERLSNYKPRSMNLKNKNIKPSRFNDPKKNDVSPLIISDIPSNFSQDKGFFFISLIYKIISKRININYISNTIKYNH